MCHRHGAQTGQYMHLPINGACLQRGGTCEVCTLRPKRGCTCKAPYIKRTAAAFASCREVFLGYSSRQWGGIVLHCWCKVKAKKMLVKGVNANFFLAKVDFFYYTRARICVLHTERGTAQNTPYFAFLPTS